MHSCQKKYQTSTVMHMSDMFYVFCSMDSLKYFPKFLCSFLTLNNAYKKSQTQFPLGIDNSERPLVSQQEGTFL